MCEKQPYFQVHTHVPQQGGCLGVVAIHDVFGGDFMSIEVHHSPHFHHSCQVVHGHRHVVQFAGSRFRWVPRVVIQFNTINYFTTYTSGKAYTVFCLLKDMSHFWSARFPFKEKCPTITGIFFRPQTSH